MLLDDIAAALTAANVADPGGTITGWSLQAGFMDPDPDQVVVIRETGGMNSSPRLTYDWPTFSVVVRGKVRDYAAARLKIEDVKTALNGKGGENVGTAYYAMIQTQGDVLPLGYDQTLRPMLSQNFQVIRGR